MNWPTSQDYNEAVQNAATTISDPDLRRGQAVVNAMGLPVPRSGNFADVYQFQGGDGRMWAVKCFTRRIDGLEGRYTKINQYLAKADLPFTVDFTYLRDGIRIHGTWFPLLKMEWVEGFTLNEFVCQNADKPNMLSGLLQMWGKLTGKLRDANMAHADLQHGNVLLVPGNTASKLGLKLIDYDGMWVPPLADYHSGEVGHPNYQHPLRLQERLYNADVDRFPHLLIACALRATALGGRGLWDKFDNGDNMLFREQDLRNPAQAPIFNALWVHDDKVLRTLLGHIALSTREPLRKTPWLDDVLSQKGGPQLSAAEASDVAAMLGVEVSSSRPAAGPSEVPSPGFDEFQPDEHLSAGTARKKKRPQDHSKLPWLIGGGAVALLAIVMGAIDAIRGSRKDETSQIVQNNSQDERPTGNDPPSFKKKGGQGTAGKASGSRTPAIDKKEPSVVRNPEASNKEPLTADAIKAKFDQSKSAYLAEVARIEKSVIESLDQAEAAAAKTNNKAQLIALPQERLQFELMFTLPRSLPKSLVDAADKLRAEMETSYRQTIKDFEAARQSDKAVAAQKDLDFYRRSQRLRVPYFAIVNSDSRLALGSEDELAERGKKLKQVTCDGKLNQQWAFHLIRLPNVYALQNRRSGQFVNLAGTLNDKARLHLWDGGGGTHNYFAAQKVGNDLYTFRSTDSRNLISIENGSKEEGAAVAQYSKPEAQSHIWRLVPVSGE